MVLFKDREIKSVSDLLTNLKSDLNQVKGPVWYRGHARESWELIPSLFRPENQNFTELELLREFKQDALLLVEFEPKTPIEWLFVMRHNHMPTRLLDWTENPLMALHFALFNNSEMDAAENGVLWMLSPLELNSLTSSVKGDVLPSFEEDRFDLSQWTPEKFSDPREKVEHKPIAFLAPRNSARMQAQQSVFTIHHKLKISLEDGDSKFVWRYIIPKDKKKDILNELHLLGINIFQLFPELDRIFDKIKETKS